MIIWTFNIFKYVSISIGHSLLCNDILGHHFVSFFRVIILFNNFKSFSCVIISGIQPFLPLSSPFYSLCLSITSTHTFTCMPHMIKYVQMYIISLSSYLSFLLCVSLSIYLLLYFSLFTRLPSSSFRSLSLCRSILLYPSIFSLSLLLPFSLSSLYLSLWHI